MGVFKTTLAYLLFALLAVAVFLYVLFPGETVKAYIDNRLAAMDPSLTVHIDSIRPALPAALALGDIDLAREGNRLIHVDRASLAPVLATLFKAEKKLECKASLADGSVLGWLILQNENSPNRMRAEAELTTIRLENIEALNALDRFTLNGPLNGRLTHDGGRAPYGKASGLLTAPGLKITLKEPVFGIEEVVMDKSEAEFTLTGQTLRLKALTFDGDLVEGKIRGRIELDVPFGLSRLKLNGNLKPKPDLFAKLQETLPKGIINPRTLGTRGMNFRINGTVENPDVSMR